jgi:hypothetical protein
MRIGARAYSGRFGSECKRNAAEDIGGRHHCELIS